MGIAEVQEWRRRRLQQAIEKFFEGKNVKLARALNYADGSYIGQMLKGKRPIDEKTVEAIERLPKLAGWFLQGSFATTTTVRQGTTVDVDVMHITKAVKPGDFVQALARATRGYTATRREKIVGSVSTLLRDGPDDDEAADLDMLAGEVELPVPVIERDELWRTTANEMADDLDAGPAREIVTTFLQAVDSKVADVRMARKRGVSSAPEPQDN